MVLPPVARRKLLLLLVKLDSVYVVAAQTEKLLDKLGVRLNVSDEIARVRAQIERLLDDGITEGKTRIAGATGTEAVVG